MKTIKAIWFSNGEQGYRVGKYGVISIIEFKYAGSMGWYPWFRITIENEITERNSMFVEEVVYEKENSDSTGEERRKVSTEETNN